MSQSYSLEETLDITRLEEIRNLYLQAKTQSPKIMDEYSRLLHIDFRIHRGQRRERRERLAPHPAPINFLQHI